MRRRKFLKGGAALGAMALAGSAKVVDLVQPHAKGADLAKPMPLPPATLGINEGFQSQSYPTSWARDQWWSGQFRGMSFEAPAGLAGYDDARGQMGINDNLNMTLDGKPRRFFGSDRQIRWFSADDRSASEDAGQYDITVSPGMTIDDVFLVPGDSIVSGPKGNIVRVKLAQHAAGTPCAVQIVIGGRIPADGIKVSMTKVGDVGTGIYSAKAAANLAALGKINRSMSTRGINYDRYIFPDHKTHTLRPAAARYRGPQSNSRLPIEAQIDACNQAGQHLWYNCSHFDAPDLIAEEMEIIARTLRPDRTAFLEHGNEEWNLSFRQHRELAVMGARLGYCDNTPSFATPETDILYNDSIGNSNVTLYEVAHLEKIFMSVSGVGYVTYQCVNPAGMPGGATITYPQPGTRNTRTADGNWKIHFAAIDHYWSRFRQRVARSKMLFAAGDAAFKAQGRNRPYHVLGDQAATSLSTEATYMLDTENFHLSVDRLAGGWYWGGGIGSKAYDMGYYPGQSNGAHPWTPAEKDLLLTDPAAFDAALWAFAYEAIDAMWAQYDAKQVELQKYLTGKGRPADAIRQNAYEGGWHFIGNSGSVAWLQALAAHFPSLMRSEAYKDATTYFLSKWAARGNEFMFFDRIGRMPYTPANASQVVANWSLQEGEGDSSARFRAVAAINAAH